MTAMALLFPLETVRTQMATLAANGVSSGRVSMTAFTRGLIAQNGVKGLYRGLPASLICARGTLLHHSSVAMCQPAPRHLLTPRADATCSQR